MLRLSRSKPVLVIAFWVLACVASWAAQESSPTEKPSLHVLFVGNSYTYFNNLPEMLAKLADAGHQKKIIYEMQAPGGLRLKDHWSRTETRQALSSEKWDYVVLQDQSTLGTNYYFEGKPRIPSDELFHTYALNFAKAIRDVNAIPVFYLTWTKKAVPEDQAALTAAYMRATRETKSIVAPAGIAWAEVEKNDPSINLFYKDGSHPSPAGTYLNACVFYATLFGRSPVGLPSRISGTPVNLDTEKVEPEKTAVLVDLPMAEAHKLQQAAWHASVFIRLHGASLPTKPPPAPSLSALPAGEPIDAANLQGTWTGQILFYPVGPVDMTLRLEPALVGWTGHLDLKYHAKDIPDESLDLTDLKIGEREITFTDPKSVDVSNLPVHFVAILTATGEMQGTAETSVEKDDHSVKVLGDWKLIRK
jgi:hypothetical protein